MGHKISVNPVDGARVDISDLEQGGHPLATT